MNTHCPVCGKEYGFFEKLTQPNMCGDCFKTGGVRETSGVVASPSSPTPASSVGHSEDEIARRSGWATFLRVSGFVSILIGLVGILVGLAGDNMQVGVVIFTTGLVGAIQSFFFAFLVDVFTDMRWFIKKLADEHSHDA